MIADGDPDANNVRRRRGPFGVQVPKIRSNLFPRQRHTPVFEKTTETSIVAFTHSG